jgi:hypothetical protein
MTIIVISRHSESGCPRSPATTNRAIRTPMPMALYGISKAIFAYSNNVIPVAFLLTQYNHNV